MELTRFTWFLFTLFTLTQLLHVSIAKSITGTKKTTSRENHKEKALYGKIYEETKHDVNRAIEDAILEASKKATVSEEKTDTPAPTHKKASKKHHEGGSLQPKHATKAAEAAAGATPTKHHSKKDDKVKGSDIDSITITSLDDDTDTFGDPATPGDAGDVKPKVEAGGEKGHKTKQLKEKEKKKEEQGEDDMNIIDSSEPSSSAWDIDDSGDKGTNSYDSEKFGATEMDDSGDKGEKEDMEAPEGEDEEDLEEKSDLVPNDDKEAQVKDSGTAAAAPKPNALPAKAKAKPGAGEGGQEDLKALLDESINNLVRANSAVEVLLRATNNPPQQQYGQAAAAGGAQQQQPHLCYGLRCGNRTLNEPLPYFQSALNPHCNNKRCNVTLST